MEIIILQVSSIICDTKLLRMEKGSAKEVFKF